MGQNKFMKTTTAAKLDKTIMCTNLKYHEDQHNHKSNGHKRGDQIIVMYIIQFLILGFILL